MTLRRIKMSNNLNFKTIQALRAGRYKNIYFEIVNWKRINKDYETWNFYLYIAKNNLTEKGKQMFKESEKLTKCGRYNYTSLDDLFDMHGGITYMSVELSPKEIYKLGCDYLHLYDDTIDWGFDMILEDVEHSIDRFLKTGCYDIKLEED